MEKNKRKVIQIACTELRSVATACALCDDGTIWGLETGSRVWMKLPPIPQDDHEESEKRAEKDSKFDAKLEEARRLLEEAKQKKNERRNTN